MKRCEFYRACAAPCAVFERYRNFVEVICKMMGIGSLYVRLWIVVIPNFVSGSVHQMERPHGVARTYRSFHFSVQNYQSQNVYNFKNFSSTPVKTGKKLLLFRLNYLSVLIINNGITYFCVAV